MENQETIRLIQAAAILNISSTHLTQFLRDKGYDISPNSRINEEQYQLLERAFKPALQSTDRDLFAIQQETNSNQYDQPIELDIEDTEDDEEDDSLKNLHNYQLEKDRIELSDERFSAFELIRNIKRDRIILDPDFQRNFVWNSKNKSEFIESIIMDFPLPLFFLNETADGKWVVIDGRQRITTLKTFFDNEFELKGLKALDELNGKRFSNLDEKHQIRLEDKQLIFYIVKPSTPMRVVYEIFKRINTGGTQLNRQEVRNCILLGLSTKLLKELSSHEAFNRAIDNGVSDKRMKSQEVVLRFLSFKIRPLEDYKGNMSQFLEEGMRLLNKMDVNNLHELGNEFIRTMNWAFKLFGKNSFRYPTAKTRGSINMALFETVSMFISNQTDEYLAKNTEQIRENYHQLLEDEAYQEATQNATSGKIKVNARFNLANQILSKE